MVTLVLLLTLAQDGGVPDRPSVTKLTTGYYLFSPEAFTAVDGEMKRLQNELAEAKRREVKKEEPQPWVQVVLVSAAVGLAVGVPAGFLLGRALPR